jgi:hypothetical protein
MRSDIVVTVSRYSRGSIESETHESQLDALRDLLSNWEDNSTEGFETVGEAIYDEMDEGAVESITAKLLNGMDSEWLIARAKEAEIDLAELKKALEDE